MLVGARYYDAQVGRFITRDTVLTEKPYVYCSHDPVNKLDPSGHRWKWYHWAIAIGIGVGVVGAIVATGGAGAILYGLAASGWSAAATADGLTAAATYWTGVAGTATTWGNGLAFGGAATVAVGVGIAGVGTIGQQVHDAGPPFGFIALSPHNAM